MPTVHKLWLPSPAWHKLEGEWCTFVIPAFRRQKGQEFKVILRCLASP